MVMLSNVVNRIGEIGLVLFLAALAILVFLQVLFRYVLNLPLFWTEEAARYCLVWASFLGAGVAVKRGQHIAVTYLVDHMPPSIRTGVVRVSQVSVAAIVAVMLWGGIQLVQVTRMQLSPALRIPMAYPYLAVPLGSAFMLMHIIAGFFIPVSHPESGVYRD